MKVIKSLWLICVTATLFVFKLPALMMLGALSGGHWDNLAEVLKATLPTLIPGVVDENFKRGNLSDILSFSQANHSGEKVKWLRSGTDAEDDVANIGRGGQTSWTESVTFTEKEAELRSCYIQRKLDKFVPSIYGTFNNYEEMMLQDAMKALVKKMGDKLIYDDFTYDGDSLEMDGLHAWAATNAGENWDIDEGEGALALSNMRIMCDELKFDFDFWLMPFCIARQIDQVYREAGIASLKYDSAGPLGLISYSTSEVGGRTTLFDNKPIIRSDFMLAEQANTGVGSDARAKYSSGTRMYSIFALKQRLAGITAEDPGVGVLFGKTEADGDFWNLEYFEKLEHYIAKGLRLSAYTNLIPGSKWALGRIFDVTNAAPTA